MADAAFAGQQCISVTMAWMGVITGRLVPDEGVYDPRATTLGRRLLSDSVASNTQVARGARCWVGRHGVVLPRRTAVANIPGRLARWAWSCTCHGIVNELTCLLQ